MILSSMLFATLFAATGQSDAGPWAWVPCAPEAPDRGCLPEFAASTGSLNTNWSVALPQREASTYVWDRGVPVLPQRWSLFLQGPVSAGLSFRPRSPRDPQDFQSAVLGTHTGRVHLVEWDRTHSRVAASWNVDGMVTGAPAWLDTERFVVGTDADTLHAFEPGGAKSLWIRHVGRCPHRRAPGPLGTRCDLGVGLEWQGGHEQIVAVADGVYALNARGQVRWQWPARGGLAQALASPVRSDGEGNLYLGSQMGYAISLDPKGRMRWSVDLGAAIHVAPVLVGQSRVCFFARNAQLACVDPQSGERLWSYRAKAGPRGPLIADPQSGRLWGSSADGSVFALDSWGQEIWRRRLRGLTDQGLVLRNDQELVAVVGGSRSVAVGIHRNTGRLTWQARLGPGQPGTVQVGQQRWLMQLRPHGELVGYWMPPTHEIWSRDTGAIVRAGFGRLAR